MICSDLFENYIKIFSLKKNYENIKNPENKKNIDDFIFDAIKNKDTTRINKIKQYIEVGFDINEPIYAHNINWLEFGIYNNDIPLVGFLIKSNADINKINKNGLNIIYTCVKASNPIMLKYFLNLNVNPNLINDSYTPLILSLRMEDCFECAKILLEDSRVDVIESDKLMSLIDFIMDKMDDGKNEYILLLELLLKRKKKLNENDMWWLFTCIFKNHIDRIKIFLNRFPSCINKSYNKEDLNTIVHVAIFEEKIELLKYLFTFTNLDYTKTNCENGNYLEFLCYFEVVEVLDLFCKKYPKAIQITYNSHSIIERILSMNDYKTENKKNYQKIKKIIEILVANGADVNYKNEIGYTLIFPAIQYGNAELVEFMIKLGAKNKEPIIIEDDEYPSIKNNDPIGFAIQFGLFETLKILIKQETKLHIITKKNIKLYLSVLLCLQYGREDCLNYLISIPKIKRWLNSDANIKNYLFDYALKHICINKSILKNFVPETKLKSINFDEPSYILSWNEKKIADHIDEYNKMENKLSVLYGLYYFIKIINKLLNINNNPKSFISVTENFKNIYFHITDSINECEEFKNIEDDFYEWIEIFSSILSSKLDYYMSCNLKKIFEYVSKIYWEIPDDEIDENSDSDKYENNMIEQEFEPKIYIKKIKNLLKIYVPKKQIVAKYENEIIDIINKYKNDNSNKKNFLIYDDTKFIKHDIVNKKLFKLYFPVKQPHYEYMYHSLFFNTDIIISSDTNIIVMSENKIKATIFEQKLGNKPKFWINTYAPNIGKEEKTDLYHMFPFILDTILYNFNCISIETPDLNNPSKLNYKCYFYGLIEFNGIVETGCYEYFLNSNGTLFHRMFKIWDAVPEYIKKNIKY